MYNRHNLKNTKVILWKGNIMQILSINLDNPIVNLESSIFLDSTPWLDVLDHQTALSENDKHRNM